MRARTAMKNACVSMSQREAHEANEAIAILGQVWRDARRVGCEHPFSHTTRRVVVGWNKQMTIHRRWGSIDRVVLGGAGILGIY